MNIKFLNTTKGQTLVSVPLSVNGNHLLTRFPHGLLSPYIIRLNVGMTLSIVFGIC